MRGGFRSLSDVVEFLLGCYEEGAAKPGAARQAPRERSQRPGRGRSAIDVLREQKVVVEREVSGKVRDVDSLFRRLEEGGAVVIVTGLGRIAVDPEVWARFREKLGSLSAEDEDELSKRLSQAELRLLKALHEGGAAYYDSAEKRWHLL